MSKYTDAVQWIADNDEPTITDPLIIEGFITVGLVADIFNRSATQVANDVAKIRIIEDQKEQG